MANDVQVRLVVLGCFKDGEEGQRFFAVLFDVLAADGVPGLHQGLVRLGRRELWAAL